jgi:hypothetical protein
MVMSIVPTNENNPLLFMIHLLVFPQTVVRFLLHLLSFSSSPPLFLWNHEETGNQRDREM